MILNASVGAPLPRLLLLRRLMSFPPRSEFPRQLARTGCIPVGQSDDPWRRFGAGEPSDPAASWRHRVACAGREDFLRGAHGGELDSQGRTTAANRQALMWRREGNF